MSKLAHANERVWQRSISCFMPPFGSPSVPLALPALAAQKATQFAGRSTTLSHSKQIHIK